MNNAKLDVIQSKIKWNMNVLWYIVFQVLKLLLIKKYKTELVNQFFHLLTDSPKPPKPLSSQNMLSVTISFCWGSVILEIYDLIFGLGLHEFAILWHKQMTLCHLLPMTMNKKLECKEHRKGKRSAKRKPNLSFISLIKIYLLIDSFYT